MNKIIRNLSIVIIFIGFLLLSSYITKSYYVFNDIEYKNIYEKIIEEEKRRKNEQVKNNLEDKKPTVVFKNMFQHPTPWMGYTDEPTKDYMKSMSDDLVIENFSKFDNDEDEILHNIRQVKNEMKNINELKDNKIKKIQKKIDGCEKYSEKFTKINKNLSEKFSILNNYIKSIENKKKEDITLREIEDWKRSIKLRDHNQKKLIENFKNNKLNKKKLIKYRNTIKHYI